MAAVYDNRICWSTHLQFTTVSGLFILVLISYFVVINGHSGCPNTLETWRQMEGDLSCQGNNSAHCLRDKKNQIHKICIPKRWSQSGYCPEFNSFEQQIDVAPCNTSGGDCPHKVYWSNEVYLYSGCWIIDTKPIKPEVTTQASERSSTPQGPINYTIIAIIPVVVVVPICILVIVVYVKRRQRGDKNREDPAKILGLDRASSELFLKTELNSSTENTCKVEVSSGKRCTSQKESHRSSHQYKTNETHFTVHKESFVIQNNVFSNLRI